MAFRHMLPQDVTAGQVRGALWSVIDKTLGPPGTFDHAGWLRIGLCGHQPSLGETYITTGSLYLCTFAFLPLGLSPAEEFWTAPEEEWTARRIWAGMDMPADRALRRGEM
jgi:hypothetical protein